MDARIQARRALELDLRHALASGEFELHYQPIDQSADRRDRRLRGAAALAPSGARPGPAGRVHPARRGDRPDRADRRMGAAPGLRGRGRAGRTTSRSRSTCRRSSSRNRGLVDDRDRARSRATGLPPSRLELEITETVLLQNTDGDARDAASAARARRPHLDGRFRHRLFVAELPAQLPVRQDQDRPLVHARTSRDRRLRRDHQARSPPRQQPRHRPPPPRASRPRSSSTSCAAAAPRCRAICSARRKSLEEITRLFMPKRAVETSAA